MDPSLPHDVPAWIRYTENMTSPLLAPFKLSRSSRGWPVDIAALYQGCKSPDSVARFLIVAEELQQRGLDVQPVQCSFQKVLFDTSLPLPSAHNPWSLEYVSKYTQRGFRLGELLWTPIGARRWEDAMVYHQATMGMPLGPRHVSETMCGEEEPLTGPSDAAGYRIVLDKIRSQQSFPPSSFQPAKELNLAPSPARFDGRLGPADADLEGVLRGETSALGPFILTQGFLRKNDWLVLSNSMNDPTKPAFFTWGDPAKRSALEKLWLEQRLQETDAPKRGSRLRL